MKVINFQHPSQKIEIGSYCGRTMFDLLKRPVGPQYLDFLRILVLPEILVHLAISPQFEKHCLC